MMCCRANIAAVMMLVCSVCAMAHSANDGHVKQQSEILNSDYSDEAVRQRLSAMALQPIEGVWYYNEEKTTLVIERCGDSLDGNSMSYRIVYVDSDDYDLLPGTVIGYIERSADKQKYALWLYSERSVQTLFKPVRCVATLSANGELLTFVKPEVKLKFRMNIARFLPTLFKGLSVIAEKGSESLPLGFKNVYPSADDDGTIDGVIRYL